MTADMATIDYFLCMPKSCPIVISDFHTQKNDSVILFDAYGPIEIRLGLQNTCIGDVINFCVLYLLLNGHKTSTK